MTDEQIRFIEHQRKSKLVDEIVEQLAYAGTALDVLGDMLFKLSDDELNKMLKEINE